MAAIKKETWREQRINLLSGQTYEHVFKDTEPNVIQINNNSQSQVLYVGLNSLLGQTNFRLSILPLTVRRLTLPQGTNAIYLYTLDNCSVDINSGECDIYPSDLDQATPVIINDTIASNVEVVKINQPLPEGTNHLGTVTLDNTSIQVTTQSQVEVTNDIGNPLPVNITVALPTGTNNIGKVDINTLPEVEIKNDTGNPLAVNITAALPTGTNNIGKVDINTLPEVEIKNDLGNPIPVSILADQFKPYAITLVAATEFTVKATAGYIAKIESSVNDIQIKNNNVVVWGNISKIDFSTPVYCDHDITLVSATGGTAYISYK